MRVMIDRSSRRWSSLFAMDLTLLVVIGRGCHPPRPRPRPRYAMIRGVFRFFSYRQSSSAGSGRLTASRAEHTAMHLKPEHFEYKGFRPRVPQQLSSSYLYTLDATHANRSTQGLLISVGPPSYKKPVITTQGLSTQGSTS